MTMTDSLPLLEITGLRTHFFLDEGTVKAVEGTDLAVPHRATVGIVGESGCGKSVTAYSILQLVERPGRIVAGRILWRRQRVEGEEAVDLARLKPNSREIRAIRGAEISMIFQEPMSSLSPVHTVGDQIAEAISLHRTNNRAEARPKAMALSCHPSLLIADEPTTALDVTTQAQILELMLELQQDFGMSILLITHNLGVVAETCDQVAVMYLGEVVEQADTTPLFNAPRHPYTEALLRSIPKFGQRKVGRIEAIQGMVPDPYNRPPGCSFHPRCPRTIAGTCDRIHPVLTRFADGGTVRCHLYGA
jgi:oligopeptide/dipeptide ABC transporter ATP-binding protein